MVVHRRMHRRHLLHLDQGTHRYPPVARIVAQQGLRRGRYPVDRLLGRFLLWCNQRLIRPTWTRCYRFVQTLFLFFNPFFIFYLIIHFVLRLTSPTVYSNLVPKLSTTDSLMSLQTSRLRLRTKVNSRHQVDFPSNLNRLHIDNHRSMYKRLMLCSSINQLHVNYRLLSKCP